MFPLILTYSHRLTRKQLQNHGSSISGPSPRSSKNLRCNSVSYFTGRDHNPLECGACDSARHHRACTPILVPSLDKFFPKSENKRCMKFTRSLPGQQRQRWKHDFKKRKKSLYMTLIRSRDQINQSIFFIAASDDHRLCVLLVQSTVDKSHIVDKLLVCNLKLKFSSQCTMCGLPPACCLYIQTRNKVQSLMS